MGLILFAALAAGCAMGLVLTATLGTFSIFFVVRRAKTYVHAWRYFAVAFVVTLALLVLAVGEYPYGTVKPGSDYEVVFKNLFLQGLGYSVSPGIAACLAALATLFAPGRPAIGEGEQKRSAHAEKDPNA